MTKQLANLGITLLRISLKKTEMRYLVGSGKDGNSCSKTPNQSSCRTKSGGNFFASWILWHTMVSGGTCSCSNNDQDPCPTSPCMHMRGLTWVQDN